MDAALYDSQEGYYTRADRQRWGKDGDYRTSPECSPLFAATFARFFAGLHDKLGSPARWTIVEAGAGAGHFAEGVLATMQLRWPEVFAATTYIIDEASQSSIGLARKRLKRFGNQVDFRTLRNIPAIEVGLVFSNELLDSFAVHRVTLRKGELSEYYVTLADSGEFCWTVGPLSTPRITHYLEFVGARLSEGQIVEVNLGVEDWLTDTAARLLVGYLVTVDYGAETAELIHGRGREQGSLRAFRAHQFVEDLLAHVGEQDLTTTIDWSFVRQLGDELGLKTVAWERQDRFLLQAGLLAELEAKAAESATEAEQLRLRTSSRQMILPDGMAARFQVLVQRKQ